MTIQDVLLSLSLKHNGEWLSIYGSLQKREKLSETEVYDYSKNVNCNYVSIIEDDYPNGLKSIYKPPFGMFYKGDYSLTNYAKPIVTIFGDPNEVNKPYLDKILSTGAKLLWHNLSEDKVLEVLNLYNKNNLFFFPEYDLLNSGKLPDISIKFEENLYFSEIWKRNPKTDYSDQLDERMYLGLGHKALVITNVSSKALSALANFAALENINIVFLKSVFTDECAKIFKHCKFTLIDSPEDIEKTLLNV